MSAPEKVYKWEALSDLTIKSFYGNTLYVLNVTSLEWLDPSLATGVNGKLWSHLVTIAVPKNLKYTNVSYALVTGGSNTIPNNMMTYTDDQLWEIDIVAHYS